MAPSLSAADEFGKSTEYRQEKSLLSESLGKEAAGIPSHRTCLQDAHSDTKGNIIWR